MEELLRRRQKLEDELKILQQEIYQSEENYIQDTWHNGNAIKGYDGYLSNKSSQRGKSSSSASTSSSTYKIKEKDRIFSDSSLFLKFDKKGRRERDTSCLSYGRIEFVDESSLIWDPVPINIHHSSFSMSNNNIVNSSEEENVMLNGDQSLSDQHLMPPPPKQIRNQFSNK